MSRGTLIGWLCLALISACTVPGDRGTCRDGVRQSGELCYRAPTDLAPAAEPGGIRLRDVDGDGDLDLTFVDRPPPGDPTAYASHILRLAEQVDGAIFAAPRVLATKNIKYYEVVRRAPGRPPDIVALTIPGVMLGDAGSLSLLTQAQPLTFQDEAFPGDVTSAAFLAARDLDSDGDDDLAVVTNPPGWWLLRNEAGTWRGASSAETPYDGVTAISFGDADGDDVPDLLGQLMYARDVTFEHLVPEPFLKPRIAPVHLTPGVVAFAYLDLLLDDPTAESGTQLDTYLWPRYETAVDLDNDGAEDLLVIAGERPTDDRPADPALFAVLLRNRAGQLQPGKPFARLGDDVDMREKPTLADLNRDGVLDIVFATTTAVRAVLSEP